MNTRRLSRAFFAAAVTTLIVDVATKLTVHHNMTLGGPSIAVFGDYVRLTYIQNPGAAFSLFEGNRWFFVGVSILSMLLILALVMSGRYAAVRMQAAFGLVLGGAMGNLIDRLWLGKVIDFLDIGVGTVRWPIFNVADIGVTVGVLLLLLGLIMEPRESR